MPITDVLTEEFDTFKEARSFVEENYEGEERDQLIEAAREAFGEDSDEEEDLAERVAERIQTQWQDGDDEERNVADVLNGGEDREEDDGEIRVDGPVVPHWERRAARVLGAMAALSEGGQGQKQEAKRVLQDAVKQNDPARMQDDQFADEIRETRRIIEEETDNRFDERRYKRLLTRRQNTDVDSEGGELLPRPFQAEVFMKIEEYGVGRDRFRSINMTSKSLELKHVSSKPVVNWVNEGNRISDSDLGLDDRVLEPQKLAGITTWTNELQEDQAIEILPILQEAYAERFSFNEDDAFFNGDGTSSYGGFTGLLNLGSATTVTMGSGNTSFPDIALGDIKDMRRNLTTVEMQGAEFFMNKDILSYLEDETEGDEIVRSVNDPNSPPRLYGHRVNLVEAMPDSGDSASDTPFVVLGNPDRIMFGQRRGLMADTSTEGVLYDNSGNVTFSAFQEDSSLIRLTERVGYAIPGIWESSICVLYTAS